MKYNILDINNKILEYYSREDTLLKALSGKKEELKNLSKLGFTKGITDEIEKKIVFIEEKIENIQNKRSHTMYVAETVGIFEQYNSALRVPQVINFMGKKSDENDDKKRISKEYMNIAKVYVNQIIKITGLEMKIPKTIYPLIQSLYEIFVNYNKHTDEKKKNNGIMDRPRDTCENCKGKKFEIMDQDIICINCSNIQEGYNQFSCYNEVDRVSISSNYSYDRKSKFRDIIYQYQGRQKCKITREELDHIEKECIRNDLVDRTRRDKFRNIRKNDLIIVLSNLGKEYEQYVKDIHYIHWKITGQPRNDISHLEQKLMDDFEVLVKEYFNNKNKTMIDRKSFINNQIIFYQLLLKYGYPCNKEDFTLLKTVERLNDQDTLCEELFKSLNWNYYSIF